MEFPDLGKNCSEHSCKQLDFLPVKCDACNKIFCKEHFAYQQHNCPEAYKKDNQVPVCPLCNAPIPVKKGEAPDYVVGLHIDNDCQSDPAKSKRKIYTNRCCKKGCKQKELIPFNCNRCQQNYCVRHRLEEDHDCQGFQGSGHAMSSAGAAAVSRTSNAASTSGPFKTTPSTTSKAAPSRKPQQTLLSFLGQDLDSQRRSRQAGQHSQVQAVQAGMSEDEAMAAAIAASLSESQPSQAPKNESDAAKRRQEEEDLALARALQASEREERQNRARSSQTSQKDKSCAVS